MIYLDNGATSYPKPKEVQAAVKQALDTCTNPGRGGYRTAMNAAEAVYRCRERAGALFSCEPEHVVFTPNCTQGLNIAIHTLVKPGAAVVVSGFEHNAVSRPLHALDAKITVAGRKLFDKADTLNAFEDALRSGAEAAIFTHVSNVFGYILPVTEMSMLCRQYQVPFVIDAAQSAGYLPVSMEQLGADFIAMPGHKGLLGPQGTGLLLCGRQPKPLICGGTGSSSILQIMPQELPDRLEAGTLNVPGIAGLNAGMTWLQRHGMDSVFQKQCMQRRLCADGLKKMGLRVFTGSDQNGTVSFVSNGDCEEFAAKLAQKGIAVRAGLHCAPLAHESAGTLETGTVRISYGHNATVYQTRMLLNSIEQVVNS